MIERYSLPEMAAIWSIDERFRSWLEVELLACEAWSKLGVIPEEDVAEMRRRASFSVARIDELERETRHDVVAFTRSVSESLGPERKWVHYGLTSTDVVDTALGYQLRRANDLLRADLAKIIEVLASQARKYKTTPMMGRTHGIHAEPTTFGLKLALWYDEMRRVQEGFARAAAGVESGKISGAVGTYANVDPFVEQYVCERLGLTPAPISTQILQRDRHAAYLSSLALIGASLETIATEIRHLQRTEVGEVSEPFSEGQKGSSAMPHKRNPVNCEQLCGLARLLRGNMLAAYEDVALWHERDISHSSVERVILPDSTLLVNYMLRRMTTILRDLRVYPDVMLRNMDRSYGLIYSQQVLLALVKKGLAREPAYDAVQSAAMRAWEERRPFRETLLESPQVREHLREAELDACFDYRPHLRHVDTIFQRLGL
ncbi:MAG TPA: adenylosuccinate lyase [Ktedonobacterales bacterium]|jgi:adenylosuccinate lyase